MNPAYSAIEDAIAEVSKARRRIASAKTLQVRNVDDLAMLKSIAQLWFGKRKLMIEEYSGILDFSRVNEQYTIILNATARHASRATYLKALKCAKTALTELRHPLLTARPQVLLGGTTEQPPEFSSIVRNEAMKDILNRRWHECRKCVLADAHLAAIVMMGGLLEALFVARTNMLADKSPLFAAQATPKSRSTSKALPLGEWTLDHYIKVGAELGWITNSAKGVAETLRDYRNYIHPEKQLRHGICLDLNDSQLLWKVTNELLRQLLLSAAIKP